MCTCDMKGETRHMQCRLRENGVKCETVPRPDGSRGKLLIALGNRDLFFWVSQVDELKVLRGKQEKDCASQ